MKCYYHQSVDAVGLCKSCGKGLCGSCLTDLGKGLACKGRCEEHVSSLITLVDRNIRLSPAANRSFFDLRRTRIGGAVFFFAMGVIFLLWAVVFQNREPLSLAMGAVFAGYGVFTLIRGLRTPVPKPEPQP